MEQVVEFLPDLATLQKFAMEHQMNVLLTVRYLLELSAGRPLDYVT
jgi:hypothetical protein